MRKKLLDSLKRVFRPEFINRLDAVIVFHALTKENIHEIVSLELRKVSDRLAEYNVTLRASEAAIDYLAKEGFDPDMGARPLRRVIQQRVEDRLSDAILSKEFESSDAILIDIAEGEIVLSKDETPAEKPEAALDVKA
jgi:ATP-dependent Clp protease ATP-binding subunit ClpC